MDLNAIVSDVVSIVNPRVPVTIQTSTGNSAPDATGRRVPTYAAPVTVMAQVQDLTSKDLRQLEGLNVQGSNVSIYVAGVVSVVQRVTQQGGDVITFEDGTTYLTTLVLERWPSWCKVSATLQA